jgi:hypothetical protein
MKNRNKYKWNEFTHFEIQIFVIYYFFPQLPSAKRVVFTVNVSLYSVTPSRLMLEFHINIKYLRKQLLKHIKLNKYVENPKRGGGVVCSSVQEVKIQGKWP